MRRRQFIAAAGAAGLAPASAFQSAMAPEAPNDRQMFELRTYRMFSGPSEERLHDFLENVAIPAYNQIGVEPVGAFTVMHGQTDPSLHVLLSYDSMEGFLTSRSRLQEQSAYRDAIDPPSSDPTYARYESQLMRAFAGMPRVDVPDALGPDDTRIFELRTYESHNQERARRKVEMFDRGEIDIFRDVGLPPIFFGETLVGDRMPNLTYMLVFEDMEHRNEVWQAFGQHPDWQEMSQDPYYADTVSNISSIVLQPTAYSQI